MKANQSQPQWKRKENESQPLGKWKPTEVNRNGNERKMKANREGNESQPKPIGRKKKGKRKPTEANRSHSGPFHVSLSHRDPGGTLDKGIDIHFWFCIIQVTIRHVSLAPIYYMLSNWSGLVTMKVAVCDWLCRLRLTRRLPLATERRSIQLHSIAVCASLWRLRLATERFSSVAQHSCPLT